MARIILFIIFINGSFGGVLAETQRLRLAVTTSTENSGLIAKINPLFEQKHNVKVDIIAVGTGKAIRLAKNGDVDLIFVHAPEAEKEFVAEGYGIERLPVMKNDFIIVGPKNDPARLKDSKNIYDAMSQLIKTQHIFISRGDNSGTHKKENFLWKMIDEKPVGDWYFSVGRGMGQTIIMADEKQAYTLSDRGTYLTYRAKIELDIVFEGDHQLINPYHVVIVAPEKHPHVKIDLARKYSEFIRSEEGQNIIRNFKVHGEVLFSPNPY